MFYESLPFLILVILMALSFDFINGFHDAANSIATIVSTRVMKPHHAVMWAAFFNMIAFLFFGVHVAATIGKGVIDVSIIDPLLLFAALFGAITWNIITWYFGIPSSSSHALVGGLAGAAVAKAGVHYLVLSGLLKIGASIVLSPILGAVIAISLMILIYKFFGNSPRRKVERRFRGLQFVSAALYSLGHGGNDAQKTMGIIAVLLYTTGHLGNEFHVPLWVVLVCHLAMGLGTLAGGWRIVKTLGMRITRLKPMGGFCAEAAGAATLFMATGLGIPVSTTHTISGAIIGVGTVNDVLGIRWKVAKQLVWAWILTIPCSAFVGGVVWWILHTIFV